MIKKFTLGLGILFLAVGILGIITGGHNHNLIIFGVNMSHNMAHVLSGLLAVAAALTSLKAAKWYCLIFGVVYGLVTLAGFININQAVTLLNLNMADNFLHLGITSACLYFGFTAKTK